MDDVDAGSDSRGTDDPVVDVAMLASEYRMAMLPLVRQLRRQGDPDLTSSSVSALAAIERHRSMTLGELARHEHVSAPMITKVTRNLEQAGLIEREVDAEDRRVTRLRVSAEGTSRLRLQRTAKNAWLARRFDTLTPSELEVLRRSMPVLRKLVEGGTGE